MWRKAGIMFSDDEKFVDWDLRNRIISTVVEVELFLFLLLSKSAGNMGSFCGESTGMRKCYFLFWWFISADNLTYLDFFGYLLLVSRTGFFLFDAWVACDVPRRIISA